MATNGADKKENQKIGKEICIYGAYIKRYANLMLLCESNDCLNIKELGLSIQESLRYLMNYGIIGEYLGDANMEIGGSRILAIYEFFERIIEDCLKDLRAVYVRILADGTVKITLEGVSDYDCQREEGVLCAVNLTCEKIQEDEVTYIRIRNAEEGSL